MTRTGGAIPRAAPRAGGLVGRYLLALLMRPLIATLFFVMPALLLERLLRLFDLLAMGGPIGTVAQLVLFLTPHYLGLAIPAAFFISVFTVIARLGHYHELDALQNAGFSLNRISRPFLLVGVLLAVGGLALYGYGQPYARYAFRAAFHVVTNMGWNATVPAGEFTRVAEGVTASADVTDPATGRLTGIFIHQRRADGSEVVTTAATGRLVPSEDTAQLLLDLRGGTQITTWPDGRVATLAFGQSASARRFTLHLPVFRARGGDEREMTLDELWQARHLPEPPVAHGRIEGELHGRLVRSLSLMVLPLLAVPMGLAAKRARRWHGIALSAVILVLYHHAIQLAESLGDAGMIDARPALWGAFLVFTGFSAAVFLRANRHPAEGPFDRPLAALQQAAEAAATLSPFRRRRAT